MLYPLHLVVKPKVGLVLKGNVDEVRKAARQFHFLRIRGVEIIGHLRPSNSSCAFLSELPSIQFARLFAAPLTDIETIQTLKNLRRLSLESVAKGQSIPIDIGSMHALTNATLEWFEGAQSVFNSAQLKILNLSCFPYASSELFKKLPNLKRLSLIDSATSEIEAIESMRELLWLSLAGLKSLENFSGISDHPNIRFLWIERCAKLRNLEWISGMKGLETLRILDCGKISGIEAIKSLPRLRHIHIHGAVKLSLKDISFLRDIPTVESVVIKGLEGKELEYWRRRNKKYNLSRSDIELN